MIKKYWEEILIFVVTLGAMLIALFPGFDEMVRVAAQLSSSRYPLMETEFPPDMRVYLSQMREGFDGKWLVSEKYTSEPHQPTILHINYLLMGKIAGWIGLDPVQAFPLWRLISGAMLLGSGYFFIQRFLMEKKTRAVAFLFFVFIGNLPILASNGIPFLGAHFQFFISWYTFLDPVKRLFFYPHYTLASAFVVLAIAFIGKDGLKDSWKAGVLTFLASLILPQSLIIIAATAFCFNVLNIRKGPWAMAKAQWPFWGLILLSLVLILFSLSYFPWNLQMKNDTSLTVPFYWRDYLSALGATGWIGIIACLYILFFRKKDGYLAVSWVISTIALIVLLGIFPITNQYRFTQIDFHLPLAIVSALFLAEITSRFNRRNLIFGLFTFLVILPAFIVWPVSVRSQRLFTEAKIKASYPLIPTYPYVVYPVRTFMEGILWLRDNSNHDAVVMAGETAGSMIPAYSGNTVYLGHGHQTVNFPLKQANMQKFYSGKMKGGELKSFLKTNRIFYVFFSLEEAGLAQRDELRDSFLEIVFRNKFVTIYKFNEKI